MKMSTIGNKKMRYGIGSEIWSIDMSSEKMRRDEMTG